MFVGTHLQTARVERKLRGFTLLELLTTLVIIGILLAASIPRLVDNAAFSERGYIDELASALRYAQRVAIASECEVSITINGASYAASLRADEDACDNNTGPFSVPVLRGDRTPLSGATPSDVTLLGGGTIIFDGDGSVANGAPPSFTTGPFSVWIDRETGTVTVAP